MPVWGDGEYDLSVAVRSSSPRYVVKALLETNLHQIGITHRNRGSILHEALKHRASDDVLVSATNHDSVSRIFGFRITASI
jgi:hypothetical protein